MKSYVERGLTGETLMSALGSVAGTTANGHRTAPSARESYPIAVTVVAARVDGVEAGGYRYDSGSHALEPVTSGDLRAKLASATLDAGWVTKCPALLLLSADLRAARTRFTDQPPEHGERFVWLEAGCMAQNAYLWAADQGLGTVLIAGLDEVRAEQVTSGLIPAGHDLLAILPLGSRAED